MNRYKKVWLAAAWAAGCIMGGSALAQAPAPQFNIPIPASAAPDEAAAAQAMNAAATNDDANAAMHMLVAAAAAHPDSAFAKFAEGVGFYRGAQYDVARILVKKAIAADPNQAAYYYVVGLSIRYDPDMWNLYESRNSIGFFKRAYQLEPRFESAYREAGAATLYLTRLSPNTDSDYDGSDVTDLAKAVQMDPNDPEAHFAAGIADLAANQYQMAKDEFGQTLSLGVTRSEVYENLGYADFSLGLGPEAMADYQKALDADPDNATAQSNLTALQGGGQAQWVPLVLEPWVVQIRDVQDKFYGQLIAANDNADGKTGETDECVRAQNWYLDVHNANLYLQQLIDLSRSDEDKQDYTQQLTDGQATEATAMQAWRDAPCG